MNKKASWAITLLLAALVPFATGCDKNPCDQGKEMRGYSESLADKINSDFSSSQFDSNECNTLRSVAQALGTEDDFKKMHEKYCDHRNPLCDASNEVRRSVLEIRNDLSAACDANSAGGRLGLWALNNDNSAVLKTNLHAALDTINNRLSSNGNVLLINACPNGAAEVANHALNRRPQQPNTYVPPIAYDRHDAPPRNPAPAPQPEPQPQPLPGGPSVPNPTAPAAGGALPPLAPLPVVLPNS